MGSDAVDARNRRTARLIGPMITRRRALQAGAAVGGGVLLAPLLRPGSAGAADPAAAPVKTASTFYTPARVAAARHNAATYDWAKAILATARTLADQFLAQTDDWLWSLQASQPLQR